MTAKLNKLINFIKGNSKDGEVQLYPSELSEIGLNELEADKLIDGLSKIGAILHKRIAFAPNRIQSSPPKQATFSSAENSTYNIPVFLLRVNEERLREVLNENLESSFEDKKAVIRIGKQTISLPPSTNEHCLCRVMFEHPIDEPIDWSVIYEEMTGNNALEDTRKIKWRMVYDAAEAVNGKVKEKVGSALFSWKEKTVRRLY